MVHYSLRVIASSFNPQNTLWSQYQDPHVILETTWGLILRELLPGGYVNPPLGAWVDSQ